MYHVDSVFERKGSIMSRRRPTGRFFILLMTVLGVAVYFIVGRVQAPRVSYAEVVAGSASDIRTMQAVIMRDEKVASMDGNSTMVFVAGEGQHVNAGDEIAYIYSAGYSTKEMEKLETIRQDIRAYHTTILSNIVDAELDRLDNSVQYLAGQLKSLVTKKTTGSLINLELQLTQAMEARQEYLRQNRREDTKLNSLYEDESKRESSISSWRSVETAETAGVVSFYLDGYEQYLSPDNIVNISIDGIRNVLQDKSADGATASRLTTNIYRLVNTDKWYILLLSSDASFNPVTGQNFWLQMEGFDDVIYQTTVESILMKSGGDTLAVLSCSDPIGPLLNQRKGNVVISAELSGLYVPAGAIMEENNLTGVMVYDGAAGSFVPVQVVKKEGGSVLVSPVVDGTLVPGNYVLVK